MKGDRGRWGCAGLMLCLFALVACGTEPAETGPEGLEDGRHFGYIRSLDAGGARPTLVFDEAEMLTGEEADRAAVEEGAIEPGESVPNDYFIVNIQSEWVTLPITDDVEIIVVHWEDCCETIPSDFEPFAASFQPDAEDDPRYRGPESPYWITVSDGEVTVIEEQYLP